MDCNKEEAIRAKSLAEDKMNKGDFVGAHKFLLNAQSLFPGLESLPQMLAVCDVHNSAEKKINGLENWYGILQVVHFADDVTIKKQVKKLSLLLHPDKNKFAGSEAAFKLVWDANRLLADKDKRSQYDVMHRIYSRIESNLLNASSDVQVAAANNAGDSIINNGTFWTCCVHCGYRYKYLRKYRNNLLYCTNGCQRSFTAYDIGFDGAPPKSSTGQTEVRNQGPCNTSVNTNAESTGAEPESVAAKEDKKQSFNRGGESKRTDVKNPKVEAEYKKNCTESSKPEKDEGKMKSAAKANTPQPKVTESKTGASKSVPDESVTRSDQAPSFSQNKNKRKKIVEEPVEGINLDSSDIVKDKAASKDSKKRKSPRTVQQNSHTEEVGFDDTISPQKKRSRSNVGLKSKQTKRKGSSSASQRVLKGKGKKNVDSGYQEISSTKDRKSEASGEELDNANETLTGEEVPDPEFSNFEPTTSSFAVNQVWSMYDPTDGMPRLYARIEKVLEPEFKLWITWLDPVEDNSIPIACGIFKDGDSQEENDHLKFSCQMLDSTQNNDTVIYPREGEIWAIFRGWDISWNASSEKHKQPYAYDYVEVLSNFTDENGIGVAYLRKVEGFVSLFIQGEQYGVLQFQIPPSEMLRFSHKVPSFKMTGTEREGVPPGWFELDTAALPKELFEAYNSKVDGKTGDPCPEAAKVEMQASKVPEKRGASSKESDGNCSNHEMNSGKKSRKSVKARDDLKLRRSPRVLSKTNNQATRRSGRRIAEKKSANNGESCG